MRPVPMLEILLMTLPRRGLFALTAALLILLSPLAEAAVRDVAVPLEGAEALPAGLALPERDGAPAVLLLPGDAVSVPQLRASAADLAGQGFAALALEGTTDAPGAKAALSWLRRQAGVAGPVAVAGWDAGGAVALALARNGDTAATVLFSTPLDAERHGLDGLGGPVMAHLGRDDPELSNDAVNLFIGAMRDARRGVEVYWYRAGAQFTAPTAPGYDADDSRLAWERTVDFLAAWLRD